MTNATLKKSVMLSMTLEEATIIENFMQENSYIIFSQYVKTLLLKDISCQRAKNHVETDIIGD